MQLFNPDLQREVCKDVELCLLGDAPTLAELNVAYGGMSSAMWLVPQLFNLSEFCGCKTRLDEKQLEECACVVATEFSFLKVSEMMLFFYRFKSGKYGRFYGFVDPVIITTSLREFVNEANIETDRYQQEEERKAAEESRKRAITYEEFCKRYKQPTNGNPIERLAHNSGSKRVKPCGADKTQTIRDTAKELTENADNTDENTLALMKDVFKKKYGMTPERYLEKCKQL